MIGMTVWRGPTPSECFGELRVIPTVLGNLGAGNRDTLVKVFGTQSAIVESTTTLSSLPTELLAKIVGEIGEDDQDETLLVLSTVCHAWKQVIEPLIYGSIHFQNSENLLKKLRLLSQMLESKPQLASLVWKLTLETYAETKSATKRAERRWVLYRPENSRGIDQGVYEEIQKLAGICPNL